MLRLIARLLLPLSPTKLMETLIEEVHLGISDGCELLRKVERREYFNLIYDVELQEIYENKLEEFRSLLVDAIERKGAVVRQGVLSCPEVPN